MFNFCYRLSRELRRKCSFPPKVSFLDFTASETYHFHQKSNYFQPPSSYYTQSLFKERFCNYEKGFITLENVTFQRFSNLHSKINFNTFQHFPSRNTALELSKRNGVRHVYRNMSSSSSTPPKSNATMVQGISASLSSNRKVGFLETVWMNISLLGSVPPIPFALGLAGAIPFIALSSPIAPFVPLPEFIQGRSMDAQAFYGACILSFLGGPHWGMAMAKFGIASSGATIANFSIQTFRYFWSVTPSLMAFSSLLMSPFPKFTILISSFVVALGVDTYFCRVLLLPNWYLPLRVILSAVAIVSLGLSLPIAIISDSPKPTKPT